MGTQSDRIEAVADAIASLGYEDITAFDEHEPEYDTIVTLSREFESDAHLALLSIVAGFTDFQLAIDAQAYWDSLQGVSLDHGSLSSIHDVKEIMDIFMEEPVNARYTSMKRDRQAKVYDYGFPEWFVERYPDHTPREVWEEVAIGLGGKQKMNQKTIVLAMKIWDIHSLIINGEYIDFPDDIAIPCDIHVKRVAEFSGIASSKDADLVRSQWAKVAREVSSQIGQNVSLLRIDSIIFQLGQVMSNAQFDSLDAPNQLVDYAVNVGVSRNCAEELAAELTVKLD